MSGLFTGVELLNTSLPLEVIIVEETHGWWNILVILRTPHRDTGKATRIETCERFHSIEQPTKEQLASWVRIVASMMLIHELDEALHVDGVRVFDPHKGEGT